MAGVQTKGERETAKNLQKLAKKYSQAVVDAAIASGELIRTEAIKSIQDGSPGETVTRYTANGNAYQHTSSEEGSAPNTDTSRLVQSIQVDVTPLGIFVGSTLEYAGHLEYGTKRMGARPWLNPAVEKTRPEVEELMGDKVNFVTQLYGQDV